MNDQPSFSDKTTEPDYKSLVLSTLNAFDARLEQLEKPKQKSLLEKVQSKASFLALVVGIVLSIVSLLMCFGANHVRHYLEI